MSAATHLEYSCPDCGGDRDYPGLCDVCERNNRPPVQRLDPLRDYTPIHGLIDRLAARAVVHLDNMTLGQHPDAAAREEGKLALIDWTVAGGPIVASGWEASVVLTARTSPTRALGATLAAAVKVDEQICEAMPLLSGLAVSADKLASRTAGGPADLALRLALCARGLAFAMLGEEGDAKRGDDPQHPLSDERLRERPQRGEELAHYLMDSRVTATRLNVEAAKARRSGESFAAASSSSMPLR